MAECVLDDVIKLDVRMKRFAENIQNESMCLSKRNEYTSTYFFGLTITDWVTSGEFRCPLKVAAAMSHKDNYTTTVLFLLEQGSYFKRGINGGNANY